MRGWDSKTTATEVIEDFGAYAKGKTCKSRITS